MVMEGGLYQSQLGLYIELGFIILTSGGAFVPGEGLGA